MGNTITRFEDWLDNICDLPEEERERIRREREQIDNEIREVWGELVFVNGEIGRAYLGVFEGWWRR